MYLTKSELNVKSKSMARELNNLDQQIKVIQNHIKEINEKIVNSGNNQNVIESVRIELEENQYSLLGCEHARNQLISDLCDMNFDSV